MTSTRFDELVSGYSGLRIAICGDFCLDRYLEIDLSRAEVSIETGLPVHNVVNVRPQPGGAGTILNNLVALGIGTIYPVGIAGYDGEGYELVQSLKSCKGVCLDHFVQTSERRTFTYCKPLVLEKDKPPRELNRLDTKNWTGTPPRLRAAIAQHLAALRDAIDALIVLDQVDLPESGVVTGEVLGALRSLSEARPQLPILADSRRGLRGFPPVIFKMNAAELASLRGEPSGLSLEQIGRAASELARENDRLVYVTLSERGVLGASPLGEIHHVPALPLRGEIDIVGAGDAVSANLAAALASGARLSESLELANAAASVVVHKLGTTGSASIAELRSLLALRGPG